MSKIPPELEAEMTPAVKTFVLALLKRLDEAEEKLEKLTPRNSSVPPSTEHPHAKPKRKPANAKAKKRKPGGQKGHKRHLRELIPSEECAAVIPCRPEACRRCGGELEEDGQPPLRHQVWDVPPIRPEVTEYQRFRGHCPCCGITTAGELPSGVPSGQCGPRLAAFTGLLMGHFRQSKRRAAMFLSDLLNIPCSPAWTVKMQGLVSDSIETPYAELQSQLEHEPQLFVDESPTKENKQKAWLWVAVAPLFTVFGIFGSRSRDSLTALIGDYSGIILNCDRAKMYLDGYRLQWCWAHLKRDIQKLIDSHDGKVRRLGHDLMRQYGHLFEQWHRYKRGEITWLGLQRLASPIRGEFERLLLRGYYSGNDRLFGFCNELHSRRQHLWTFLEVEGIEPTNNAAERALRPAVIYRKLSFGTQSTSGSRYLERILTVSETCRKQKRNAFEYLVAAVEARFANQPAPSLLPPETTQSAAA
jgi:transposase